MRRLQRPCLAVLLVASLAADAPTVRRTCKADVVSMTDALIKGDFAKAIDLTHPKVIASLGGRAKAMELMAAGARQMKAGGFAFLSAAIDDPSDPVASGSDLYVVVPYTLVTKDPGGRRRQRSFVVGVSTDGGQSWKYVNGDLDPAGDQDRPAQPAPVAQAARPAAAGRGQGLTGAPRCAPVRRPACRAPRIRHLQLVPLPVVGR